MQKSNEMSRPWIIAILTLSILTLLLSASLLFRIGPVSTFYTIDPDVPYLSNSLLYITDKRIVLNVHPGTPTIALLSYVLFPLRVYTHFALKTNFIDWVFQNIQYVYHLVRYFQAILLSFSVGVFLLAIFKSTKSIMTIVLVWLSLYIFSQFPYFGTSIVPETLSFFLVSFWLLIFSFFVKSRSPVTLALLSFLSGVAFANKFTSLPLVIISPFLVFTLGGLTREQKIYNLFFSGIIVCAGFIFSTWPIRQSYPQLFNWVSTLATTTGAQGGGKKALFDLTTYMLSARTLINRERLPFYLFIFSILSISVDLIFKKLKFISPLTIVAIGALISTIIFSKYPLNYYQLVNYALIVYLASIGINKFPGLAKMGIMILFISIMAVNITKNYSTVLAASQKERALEEYIISHPPQKATAWEWGRAKDFSLLWARDWAGIFTKEIASYRPNLYELSYTLNTIKLGSGQEVRVFDACWDQLYIQQSSSVLFLEKYNNRSLKFEPIQGSDDMGIIKSTHCISSYNK